MTPSSTLTYVIGGKLGDLFHCLWIIKRKWEIEKKKGVLVLTYRYGGDLFSYDIKETYIQ